MSGSTRLKSSIYGVSSWSLLIGCSYQMRNPYWGNDARWLLVALDSWDLFYVVVEPPVWNISCHKRFIIPKFQDEHQKPSKITLNIHSLQLLMPTWSNLGTWKNFCTSTQWPYKIYKTQRVNWVSLRYFFCSEIVDDKLQQIRCSPSVAQPRHLVDWTASSGPQVGYTTTFV